MTDREIDDHNTIRWYENGRLHRVGGLAVEFSSGGSIGELHRDDGPAIEYANGGKEWWVDNKEYTHEEFILLQFSNGITINE